MNTSWKKKKQKNKTVDPEDYAEIQSCIRHTLAPWRGYSIIMNRSENLKNGIAVKKEKKR